MRILNRILMLYSVCLRKLPAKQNQNSQTSSTFQSIIWLIRFIDSTPWFGVNWLKALIILSLEFGYKIIGLVSRLPGGAESSLYTTQPRNFSRWRSPQTTPVGVLLPTKYRGRRQKGRQAAEIGVNRLINTALISWMRWNCDDEKIRSSKTQWQDGISKEKVISDQIVKDFPYQELINCWLVIDEESNC